MRTMERSARRRPGVALGAALVSLALIAGACSSDSKGGVTDDTGGSTPVTTPDTGGGNISVPPTDPPLTPVAGGTLRYGIEADVDGLNPTTSAFSAPGYLMGDAVFDNLAALDENGKAVPFLAESFTPSADFISWTVKVRSGIKFHDGTDLNAEAVKTAFEAQLAAPLVGLAVRPFYPETGAIEIVDDLSVKFNLLEANAYFPNALTSQLGMIPSPTWLAAAKADPTLNQAPVGTGPFIYDSRSQDSVTKFVRNPDYWGGEVLLDAIEFYPVTDAASMLDLLVNGELDAMQTTDQQSIIDLKDQADTFNSGFDDTGEESFAMINSETPPFDDIRVRQALTFATPLENYRTLIGLGISRPADQEFTPESPYYNPDVKQEGDQPDKAIALATEYCGEHPDMCTDGKINMEYQFSGPSVVQTRISEILNEGWKVAFNVKFDELSQSDHIQQTAFGQYNVNTWRQFGAADPWADNVWLLCRTVGGISLNWPRYCDPARDELLLKAQASTDPAERVTLYKQLVQNMHDAYTYVFFTHTIWANSFAKKVHGTCGRTNAEGIVLKCANNGTTWYNTTWMES